jgi:hypothetical protein
MKSSRNRITPWLLALALLAFIAFKWRFWESHKTGTFNRHPFHLVYTHHAECRMDCRHISKEDINAILQKGTVLFNKTDLHDRPCPTYAVQGYTDANENIRVIFAQCDSVTKVVTCYNLHREFDCNCPGDKNASINLHAKNSNE